jgi:hypothetical protein
MTEPLIPPHGGYRKQNRGVMQKLLTGEWRVKPDRR